jgi:ABC-2 type transport system ATP-binding protein
MRQRLGLAHALLGEPQVLILDEPANGLDPAGIHWMRSLLRTFAERGGTVLLSSHLLHEMQIIADDLIVIGKGKIVAQGSKDELLKGSGTFVRALDPAALLAALKAAGVEATRKDEGFHIERSAEEVAKVAADAGVVLVEIRESSAGGLEEMFLELTSETQRDALPRYGGTS